MTNRGDTYGIAIERDLRELSGLVGVADFVFKPVELTKGKATREVGDFLLWVGSIVAVVSVKTRHPEKAATDNDQRKRSWLHKTIAEARRQIGGVVRSLKTVTAGELFLESERGVQVPWDPSTVKHYVGVILIDAQPPSDNYSPPVMNSPVPTIAVLAKDWDFLHQAIPSTTAIINYAAIRQSKFPSIPLGSEPDIFALLAENEGSGGQIQFPEDGLPRAYWREVMAREPALFFGALPSHRFARIIDAMIQAAADQYPLFTSASSPADYMRIVEFLDRIPMLQRIKIGESVLDLCREVGAVGGAKPRLFGLPHGLMVALVDNGPRKERVSVLQSLSAARHSQALDAGARNSLITLGVATQPIPTAGRSHDFCVISGGIRSDSAFREQRDRLFGIGDLSESIAVWEDCLPPTPSQ